MDKKDLILTFDVGTQSLRAMLINDRGDILARVTKPYEIPYYSRNPNWAEQRPDLYFEKLCSASMQLKVSYPTEFSRVCAVAITVFRDTVVCVDKNGIPLRDCILWMDQRRAENPRPLPPGKKILFETVGMMDVVSEQNHVSVCNYLAEKEPEMWEKMDKYILLSTYLNFKLTGRMADSDAGIIGHLPFDYRNRTWDKNGLTRCLYDIPQEKLCEIVPAGSILGGIPKPVSVLTGIPEGMPLIATGSDKGCETLGLSVISPEKAAISFGTSATIQFASSRYFEPRPFLPAYPAVPNHLYNGEVQLLRGFWMLTWFKQNFAREESITAMQSGRMAEELLNEHLKDVPPGSDGLMILPHWTPGLSTPSGRGAMIGFSDVHTKYHMYRAIIEGVIFGLMEGKQTMERSSGQTITQLYAGGGGSQSDEILQIAANMFGLPVHRIQTNEACSLGAAVCAFVTIGRYSDYESAVRAMVHDGKIFEPDENEHVLYDQLYHQVFSKYYRTLLPLHKRIIALTKRIIK